VRTAESAEKSNVLDGLAEKLGWLLRHGRKIGSRIKELISIVSYSTLCRWVREMEETASKRPANKHGRSGRPRVEESLSETIIRICKETGWEYTKVRPLCFPYE
jgi:putative transposase